MDQKTLYLQKYRSVFLSAARKSMERQISIDDFAEICEKRGVDHVAALLYLEAVGLVTWKDDKVRFSILPLPERDELLYS